MPSALNKHNYAQRSTTPVVIRTDAELTERPLPTWSNGISTRESLSKNVGTLAQALPGGAGRASCRRIAPFIMGSLLVLAMTTSVSGRSPSIQFDMASTVPASPVEVSEETASITLDGSRIWSIPIEVSALIPSSNGPRISQLLIEVDLLDEHLSVVSYSPRTQTESPYVGEIAVERGKESSKHLGFNVAGSYPPVTRSDAGGDLTGKRTEQIRYAHVAPVQVVAAAGTTNRRRGVFFKFLSTPTQVLEGDRQVSIEIRSPASWRGGLLAVRIRAQSNHRSLPGIPAESVTLEDQRFLVATYRADDLAAQNRALQLGAALENLHMVASKAERAIEKRSRPTVFHQIATKLDLAEPKISNNWLQRSIFGTVDPHTDHDLKRLPVTVRVAVLDFQDARTAFLVETESPKVAKTLSQEPAIALSATP